MTPKKRTLRAGMPRGSQNFDTIVSQQSASHSAMLLDAHNTKHEQNQHNQQQQEATTPTSMTTTSTDNERVIILGAAGRDFHDFQVSRHQFLRALCVAIRKTTHNRVTVQSFSDVLEYQTQYDSRLLHRHSDSRH